MAPILLLDIVHALIVITKREILLSFFFTKVQTAFLYFHLLLQKGGLILCVIMASSCSRPACRQWELQENTSQICCFNAVRLILGPDSDYTHLELEILRTASAIRFYINLLFLQALPCSNSPERTEISIQFKGEDPWIVYPYIMEGGQRLLLPEDVAEVLINSLCEEKNFIVQVGRNQMTAINANFVKSYTQLTHPL